MRFTRYSSSGLLALLLFGCGGALGVAVTKAVKVQGRTVSLPAPPGMVWSEEGRPVHRGDGTQILGYFVADTTWRRWEAQRHRGPRRFWAAASAEIWVRYNADPREAHAEARGVILSLRAEADTSYAHDTTGTAAWRAALQTGLAGHHASLPPPPSHLVMLEMTAVGDEQFAQLVGMRAEDGSRTIIGTARIIANDRVISLDVLLNDARECAELQRVRSTLLAWMDATSAANAKR